MLPDSRARCCTCAYYIATSPEPNAVHAVPDNCNNQVLGVIHDCISNSLMNATSMLSIEQATNSCQLASLLKNAQQSESTTIDERAVGHPNVDHFLVYYAQMPSKHSTHIPNPNCTAHPLQPHTTVCAHLYSNAYNPQFVIPWA